MSYSRGPPTIDGMTSLKVDNLTYRTTPEELKRVFEKHGHVGDVYIPRHPFSKDSRGFAFVRFYDKRDAEDAMDALDGYTLDGRELRVQMARYGRPNEDWKGRSNQRVSGGRRYGYRRRSRSRSRSRGRRRGGSRSRSRSHSRSRSRSRDRNSRRRRSRSGSRSLSGSPGHDKDRRRDKSESRLSRSRSASHDRKGSAEPDVSSSHVEKDTNGRTRSNSPNDRMEDPPRRDSRSLSRSASPKEERQSRSRSKSSG